MGDWQKPASQHYPWGFETDVEVESFPLGLNEDIIKRLSAVKNEPQWLLEFRLKAYAAWKKMSQPRWALVKHEPIDFQNLRYYAAPKKSQSIKSLDDLDPELKRTFERLGIPLSEQARLMGVAIDLVFDSVSLIQTQKKLLEEKGVIFCSISEAVQNYPDLVRRYLASVVPITDNYYAALNSAVFSDGSFVYIPKGVKCPVDLSTYFRMNTPQTGQFERTLIIADEGSQVNYLEGCTAPMRDEYQMHAAVVELVALDGAFINYSTVQNWYTGDERGQGGVYNFVTKRGLCAGQQSRIHWTQIEVGSAITWKYPSCILKGPESVGEFYSVALTQFHMQADTGTKMIHIGPKTRSRIVSKGISSHQSLNVYRGLVKVLPGASQARNFTQCDSLLVGSQSRAVTLPYVDVRAPDAIVEHEASVNRLSDEQLFYLQSRGLTKEQAIGLIVDGFCREVFQKLPLEFATEAVKLVQLKMEDSIGQWTG